MANAPATWHDRLASVGRGALDGLLQIVYPATCVMCKTSALAPREHFCTACEHSLTDDANERCPRCAATVGPFTALEGGCSHCRDDDFAFDGALRLGPYEGLLRDAILRMKHAAGEMLAECLGLLWGRARLAELRGAAADVVVPVPLHWWRRWSRGYNQSEALAHSLAAVLGLPCRTWALRRARLTPPQTQLTPAQRRENLRKVFRTCGLFRDQCVLLVDDVLTTGSTASAAAIALKKAGARKVNVAVLARSLS
jgi:ComF family protein